jgi:hypothetical protein
MNKGLAAAGLILVVIASGFLGYYVGSGGRETKTLTTTASETLTTTVAGETHYATPVSPTFYIGGQNSGSVCFTVSPGSQSSVNVTVTFPRPSSYNYTLPIEYSFAPYPLDSAFPTSLHPSMFPPYVVMQGGQSATASLQMMLDSSVRNGQEVSFALHANFNDPLSGDSVVNVIVVNVVANASARVARAC